MQHLSVQIVYFSENRMYGISRRGLMEGSRQQQAIQINNNAQNSSIIKTTTKDSRGDQ